MKYLVTNIDNNLMNTKEIGELYYKRWGIELAYGVIKNKLDIENISGKNKLVIEQDFYDQMLLFNMNILVGTFREYVVMITLEPDP